MVKSVIKPKVSIVMNCYNGESFLEESIQSVYNQSFNDWEIVFWDNCSTDNSKKIAKSFDDKLKYYEGTKKLSLGLARNESIKKLLGDLVAFLDCDDVWLPEKLNTQLSILNDKKDIDLIYTNASIIDENGKTIHRQSDQFRKRSGNVFRELLLDEDFINFQTIIFYKSLLKKSGGFLNYELVEDYDLLLKLSEKNYFYGVNEVLVKTRIHYNNTGPTRKIQDNDPIWRMRKKNYGAGRKYTYEILLVE